MGNLNNKADYSQYKCPYSHLEKDCGHELKGPEGFENTYGIWCACGFRGPVFYLDPEELNLEKIDNVAIDIPGFQGTMDALNKLSSFDT